MASRREAVADAIVAALEQASVTTSAGTTRTKPDRLSVHRLRTRPLEEDDLPATVVYFRAEELDYDASRKSDRRLRFGLEHRVDYRGSNPDTALDPLVTWGVQALMADITLGGVAVKIDEFRTAWAAEETDLPIAAAATEFEVTYQTAWDDPESTG